MRGDLKKTKAELIAELDALRAQLEVATPPAPSQALQESEERFRIVSEKCRDGISVSNAAGELIYVNPAMKTIFGYTPEETLGTQLGLYLDDVHPEDRATAEANFEKAKQPGGTVYYSPLRCRRADGNWIWITTFATSYQTSQGERYLLEVYQDITEQVEAEQQKLELVEQVQEAQRLESLGVLAGGIAHDFNNLLTPILGDTSLALLDLAPDAALRPRLKRIQQAAQRAASLTDQMLAYSGQGPTATEALDVSQLVEEMAQLLDGAVSGGSDLVYHLADDLSAIEADPAQLSQVVMNLISNATESALEGRGRTVLRTGQIAAEKVERKFLVGSETLTSDHYVFIEVSDNGCGMDAETRAKIFDPFFTTKFTGRGLGLAATLGIVRGHRGLIELESEPGQGTRFRVLFPSTGRRALRTAPRDASIEVWRGRGTVLVADDDEPVRELVAETLRRAGLTVLLARDGHEAIEIFRRRPNEIQVVVLDRTMPKIGGEEAFAEIRRIRPDAHIILVSGYSEERAAWRLIDLGLDAFLHKPFEPMELLAKVRHIIEGDASERASRRQQELPLVGGGTRSD